MRPLNVFLCHASQDKPTVRKLYNQLKSQAWIEPWLDEENLIPGQDWDLKISRALRETDAIIVCLSRASVSKEGYIQKEIKRALDIYDEKPEETIYIIPLRLDDCEVPPRLKRIHWVDYFDKKYKEKLLHALEIRAKSLKIYTQQKHAKVHQKSCVFISYNEKDKEVALAYKKILEATGLDVLVKSAILESDQEFNSGTMRMIERADIFQILWSENYSRSRNCRMEWEYALKQNKDEGFIRPVFWQKPLTPKPPEELNKFNFKYVELN